MKFSRSFFIENAKKNGKSEEFINECLNYAENLLTKNLPVIFSKFHLAKLLKITIKELDFIVNNRNKNYKIYKIRKKRGGVRIIMTPSIELKNIQKWILNKILNNIPVNNNCYSYLKGKSIIDNAKLHTNKQALLKIDLKDFYYTIKEEKVYKIFKNFGYETSLSSYLAKLTTANPYYKNSISSKIFNKNNFLPIGSPSSPMLSNIYCTKLDIKLNRISLFLGISYSRYADDLTFSGNLNNLPDVNEIKRIIEKEGLKINYKKVSLKKNNSKQIVTGINVNNGLHVLKKLKKNISQHLYYCKKYGVYDHLNKTNNKKNNFKQWLLGNIYFIKSVESKLGKKFLDVFEKINWPL